MSHSHSLLGLTALTLASCITPTRTPSITTHREAARNITAPGGCAELAPICHTLWQHETTRNTCESVWLSIQAHQAATARATINTCNNDIICSAGTIAEGERIDAQTRADMPLACHRLAVCLEAGQICGTDINAEWTQVYAIANTTHIQTGSHSLMVNPVLSPTVRAGLQAWCESSYEMRDSPESAEANLAQLTLLLGREAIRRTMRDNVHACGSDLSCQLNSVATGNAAIARANASTTSTILARDACFTLPRNN